MTDLDRPTSSELQGSRVMRPNRPLKVALPENAWACLQSIATVGGSELQHLWNMVDLSKTVVIKIGTSSLIREDVRKLNISCLAQVCEIVSKLRAAGKTLLESRTTSGACASFTETGQCITLTTLPVGHPVIIVSSGAVAAGGLSLGLAERPAALAQRQALAATGQIYLMRYWQDFFTAIGLVSARRHLSHTCLGSSSPAGKPLGECPPFAKAGP